MDTLSKIRIGHRRGLVCAALVLVPLLLCLAPLPAPGDGCGDGYLNPNFLSTWQSLYPGSSTDDNLASECQVCHVQTTGGDPWNDYGWAVRSGSGGASSKISAAAGLDSDGDPGGSTNLEEILASAQPGWTAGPVNTAHYKDGSTQRGIPPPSGVQGDLDPSASPWSDLGGGTTGIVGPPLLTMSGPLTASSFVTLDLVDGAPSALAIIFISFTSSPAPFLGGTLHAFPYDELVVFGTDAAGEIHGSASFPGATSGAQLWFQVGLEDASVPVYGASLSNGVVGTVP
jgi:hypothetical protein